MCRPWAWIPHRDGGQEVIFSNKVEGNAEAAWHKCFYLPEKRIWIACILPCRDASALSEWVRVQVFSLESQTVSLAPECGALFISQQQRRVLSLACRISSDPCESVPVMALNAEHQQGTSISSLATFCFSSRSPQLSSLFAQKCIIPTLFRLNGAEDLGEKWKEGGLFGRELPIMCFNNDIFLFIGCDRFPYDWRPLRRLLSSCMENKRKQLKVVEDECDKLRTSLQEVLSTRYWKQITWAIFQDRRITSHRIHPCLC